MKLGESSVLNNTIIRAVVGSTMHGVNIEDADDRDELGVCIEPSSYVIGFNKFDTYTKRTQPDGVKSGPGDLDLTIHSLRKYIKLALGGNPTVLSLLFVPKEYLIIQTDIGEKLQSLAPKIVSQRAGKAFLGYIQSQRLRLIGELGQKRTNRPELVKAYGYDTKYAYHMLRLGIQGIELLENGCIILPMLPLHREFLINVRHGRYSLEEVLGVSIGYERRLVQLMEEMEIDLRPEPDSEAVNQFLVDAYQIWWGRS